LKLPSRRHLSSAPNQIRGRRPTKLGAESCHIIGHPPNQAHHASGSRQGPARSVLENLNPARSVTSDNTRPPGAGPPGATLGRKMPGGRTPIRSARKRRAPTPSRSTLVARRASDARSGPA